MGKERLNSDQRSHKAPKSVNGKGTYQTISTPDTPRTSVPFGRTVQLFATAWLTVDPPPATPFCLLATTDQAR